MNIDTGHIIAACSVRDGGYSHPREKNSRRDKDRPAPRGFKFRDLVKVRLVSNLSSKEGKELLSWMLKHT